MVDMNINLSGADGPKKKNNNKVPSYLSGDNSSQQSGSIFNDYQYKAKEIKVNTNQKSQNTKSKANNKPMQQIEDSYKMPEKKDYSVIGGMKAQDKKLANASNKPAFEMSKAEKTEVKKSCISK